MRSTTRRDASIARRLTGIAACAAAFALSAAAGTSMAQGTSGTRTVGAPQGEAPDKAGAGRAAPQAAQHHWYDGGKRRELTIDPSQVADFGKSRKGTPLRSRGEGEKDAAALPAGVSPVFRDAASPASLRALPGGVIVTLRLAPAGNDAAARESDARSRLKAAGLEPLRAIDPGARRWLVASPAGLPSLELANRLHESGDFESAAPNWWQARALK